MNIGRRVTGYVLVGAALLFAGVGVWDAIETRRARQDAADAATRGADERGAIIEALELLIVDSVDDQTRTLAAKLEHRTARLERQNARMVRLLVRHGIEPPPGAQPRGTAPRPAEDPSGNGSGGGPGNGHGHGKGNGGGPPPVPPPGPECPNIEVDPPGPARICA